jgi:hypothetical protein
MDSETLKPEWKIGNLSPLMDSLEPAPCLRGAKNDRDPKLVYLTELSSLASLTPG